MSDAINVLLKGSCFLVLGLVFCLGPVAAQPAPPEVEPVGPRHFVGAWKTTEIAVTTPDSSWTIEQPARLYMFTLYFYSATSLWEERPLFTEETTDAILLGAREEALILDPVYTGKAFAGFLDFVRRGELDDEAAVFLHTGGIPALFAYSPEALGLVASPTDLATVNLHE